MLQGILVVHTSGVLIASKGRDGKIKQADRVSNLLSATLLLAKSIQDPSVKVIQMDERNLTITRCPTHHDILVATITDKGDENASIIA